MTPYLTPYYDCLTLTQTQTRTRTSTQTQTQALSRQKKQRPPKPGGRSLVPMSPRGSNPTPGKPVKRSSSFDRFTRGRGSAPGSTPQKEKEKAGPEAPPQQTLTLHPNPNPAP